MSEYIAPVFPSSIPHGFVELEEPIEFDAEQHLALEFPDRIWKLQDLGYTADEAAQCATDFAIASPARMLSDSGAQALLDVARNLRTYTSSCDRVQNMVRGGVYRSRFLRDLCTSKQVTEFVSDIYGIAVAPHSMPSQLGHLNYTPTDINRAVDKWHHDTLELDYVMMISDPSTLKGGEFQFFLGTKAEAADIAAAGETMPADRVISPHFPSAGYFVPFHGSMVVHRGAKLEEHAERITMVNGYVPLTSTDYEANRFDDLRLVDPDDILITEWARHKSWLAQNKLRLLNEQLAFGKDVDQITTAMKAAIKDVEDAISDIESAAPETMLHYGGD
ncbi:MAG: hypothetical protein AAF197_03690 [Pseudomonadota bacterium]